LNHVRYGEKPFPGQKGIYSIRCNPRRLKIFIESNNLQPLYLWFEQHPLSIAAYILGIRQCVSLRSNTDCKSAEMYVCNADENPPPDGTFANFGQNLFTEQNFKFFKTLVDIIFIPKTRPSLLYSYSDEICFIRSMQKID
jgi:hypothetical protein